MKSLFRTEQEGFLSSETAEKRCFDSARFFVCLFCFKTKFQSSAVNFVKYFDFDDSVYAGLNIFLAISIWEKREGRQSRCHAVRRRTGDLAPVWQTASGRVGTWCGCSWAQEGTAKEEGESWKPV